MHIIQRILTVNDTLNQCQIVLLLREYILYQGYRLSDFQLIGVLVSLISCIQFCIVFQLSIEFPHNVRDQSVFIFRHVHLVKIVTQELAYLSDLLNRDILPCGNRSLPDFTLLAQHIGQLGIVRLDRCATVFDCYLLVTNQHGHNSCNINLSPAIGILLEIALHIRHGSRKVLIEVDLQVLLYFGSSVTIRLCAGEIRFFPA